MSVRVLRKILGFCGLGTVWYLFPREDRDNGSTSYSTIEEAIMMDTIHSVHSGQSTSPNVYLLCFSFLSLVSFGVGIYSPYTSSFSMESIQTYMYSCLYTTASMYTRCSRLCETITALGKRIVYQGYQYIAPTVEKIAVCMEWTVPHWLQSESTRREWEEIRINLIQAYPWVGVYATSTTWYTETYKTLHDLFLSNQSNQSIQSNQPYSDKGALRFILFRVLKDNVDQSINQNIDYDNIIYRRLNSMDDAEEWWEACSYQYDTAKQNILNDYIEEHPFIQLTPRNTKIVYDWRDKIRPFSVRNNRILDKDFIEWCLFSENHTIDDHYPLDYIDCNINMGQLHNTHHVIVGEGVHETI